MTNDRHLQIKKLINVGWLATYGCAIGFSEFPLLPTLAVCASVGAGAHLAWMYHRKGLLPASIESRAALIRAASGHPESERLVHRALCNEMTTSDVQRVFRRLCEAQDATRRSLVTRAAHNIVAQFIANDGRMRWRRSCLSTTRPSARTKNASST